MRFRSIFFLAAAAVAGAASVGLVLAALGDTQTATGSVNVSTTSADLYICEPGNVAGPACGPDDSDGGELVFENLEDIRPGDQVYWDVRLKNVGTVPFTIVDVGGTIAETSDPEANCPAGSLSYGSKAGYSYPPRGLYILGKGGDDVNDNTYDYEIIRFRTESDSGDYNIVIAPGDYEDVRLRLKLARLGTENCDGNTWDVSYDFVAN